MISPLRPGVMRSNMVKFHYLCLLFSMAGPITGLTATSEGLGVRQFPSSLNVRRGETATLSCRFQVESLKYGVQWFKMTPEKLPIRNSSRRSLVEENRTSSLVIAQAVPEDSGLYYCEVNVLQKDPESGNGTELVVLAPPSAPKIFLQIPPDPQTGQWVLLCLTRGFYPGQLTLAWTYRSEAGIDHLSVSNCTVPFVRLPVDPSENPEPPGAPSPGRPATPVSDSAPACSHVTDDLSREVYLISALSLPPKHSLDAGITFTCRVQDHPALNDTLTASFKWDGSPNELIIHLNILKMCFLSGMTMVFLWDAIKHFCMRRERSPPRNKT